MINTALAESQLPDEQSQAFSRQLYIDGVSYLLHGLPSDLAEPEVLQLQVALPEALERPSEIEAIRRRPQDASILHRTVAMMIIALCLFLRLAVPYVKYLLATAHSYEDTHHVARKLLSGSVTTLNSFGKRSMEIAGIAMENELVIRAVAYCVEGVCGGLNEGLMEGMKVIEAQDRS